MGVGAGRIDTDWVAGGVFERTPELDRARMLLFPDLLPEEGWAQIESAIFGSLVEAHWRRLEQILDASDLTDDLVARHRTETSEQEPAACWYRSGRQTM